LGGDATQVAANMVTDASCMKTPFALSDCLGNVYCLNDNIRIDIRAMAQLKKKTRIVPKAEFADRLAHVLAKRKKAELIEAIVEIARADRGIMRQLTMRFSVEAPLKELVVETRQAIIDATDFDEREINYNFDYDYQVRVSKIIGGFTPVFDHIN
jgi:hypothetical protein